MNLANGPMLAVLRLLPQRELYEMYHAYPNARAVIVNDPVLLQRYNNELTRLILRAPQ